MKKTCLLLLIFTTLIYGCANMGSPEGGLYDETPPRVLSASPADKSTNVKSKHVAIHFDEYITVENATEKVVISPPQNEMPEIKTSGKDIVIELKDTLKEDITYTIDFSDAIVDFHEGNPMGNYTYSFSTGEKIDTFEVSGYVVDAMNFEPVKGILVGLYSDLSDSAFTTKPMERVSRTDGNGHFVIKGVSSGTYRAYALQDVDGDYRFSQKGEMLAFDHHTFSPSTTLATRQDTLWRDSLHIESINIVPYTRFIPDDITLLAFTEAQTDRHLIKTDRTSEDHFTLYFSYGSDTLPTIKGLNFDATDNLICEVSERKDTLTYWLRDTALINRDSLLIELQYLETDTLGMLVGKTDTLELIPKLPFERRQKLLDAEHEQWEKLQEKRKKRGEPYDSIMPPKPLEPKYQAQTKLTPDAIYTIEMPVPLDAYSVDSIHLYAEVDSTWYRAPFEFRQKKGSLRQYELIAEWREGTKYSLEIDTLAFRDIYGRVSTPYKTGIEIGDADSYSSLLININSNDSADIIIELIDKADNIVRSVTTENGHADIYYITPGTYYLKAFADANGNGLWDTGLYAEDRQAERIYYYNKEIECKEKWDVTIDWNLNAVPVMKQKPSELIKQKGEETKNIRHRNYDYMMKHKEQYAPLLQQYRDMPQKNNQSH